MTSPGSGMIRPPFLLALSMFTAFTDFATGQAGWWNSDKFCVKYQMVFFVAFDSFQANNVNMIEISNIKKFRRDTMSGEMECIYDFH